MSRTVINVGGVIDASQKIDSAKTSVGSAKNAFTHTKNSIDEKIKSRYNIHDRLNAVQSRLLKIESKISRIHSTVQSGANRYQSTDNKVEAWRKSLKNGVGVKSNGGVPGIWAGYFKNTDDVDEIEKKADANKTTWKDRLEEILSKTKPHVIESVLNMVSPISGLLYITSGIVYGEKPSVLDSSRIPSANADADWLGYELSEGNPGITAWVGKANAEAQNDWGYVGVNAYVGKAKAEAEADFSFMETTQKKEYNDGKWVEKTVTEFVKAEASAGGSVSVFAGDAEAGAGSDMLGAEVQAEGSVGTAKAEAKGTISVSEDGIDLNVEGEAMVTAVEGQAKGTINILGIEITGKIGGYAGAVGVEGKVGIEDNKFVVEGGVAALLGVSGGVEIGFNDEGWNNFVDFVTFWD